MNEIVTLLVVFLFGIALESVQGFGVNFWKYRHTIEKENERRLTNKLNLHDSNFNLHASKLPSPNYGSPYPEHYLRQNLDHFDAEYNGTYMQRYWVNSDFWRSPNGPVFLYIGGEGGLTSLTVQTGEHVTLAKKYGAMLLAVEHRFYGSSINDDGLELKNLRYLSSQQALADLSTFHAFATKTFGLNDKTIWISFGGSYPGALSAWFRIKYPHLVHGAIASSAPVKAKVDFQGYNDVVAASLSDPVVNGSKKCMSNVRDAFTKVDGLLEQEMFDKLYNDFHSCGKFKADFDIYQFASNIADAFMGTVQYNAEAGGMNITGLCNIMTQPKSPYENLIQLNKVFLDTTSQNCSDNSWENFIKQLSDTSVERVGGVGLRQWTYQTCAQFGYYQSCDKGTTCPFSKFMALGPNLEVCRRVFRITPDSVYDHVDFSNDYYGADQPHGTRIVFVNGSIDPWHALSVLRDLSKTETAIYINGTAHCANMGNDKPTDPSSLTDARQKIDSQIGQWLKDAGISNQDTKLYFHSKV